MTSSRDSYTSENGGYNHDSTSFSEYANRNEYVNENDNPENSNNNEWDDSVQANNMHPIKKAKTAINNLEPENEEDDRLVYENDSYQIHGIGSSSRDCERGINDCDYDFEIDSGQTSTNGERPVIYVYAVDPELDLECTSEEEDCHINRNENEGVERERSESDENENVIQTSAQTSNETGGTDHVEEQQKDDELDFSFEMSAVINVDDFFIKENKEPVKLINENSAVVSNVDVYFIKDSKNIENKNQENPDNFVINGNKKSSATVSQQHQPCSIPRDVQKESLNKEEEAASFDCTPDTFIENARIHEIKRFLMEDLPVVKGNTKPIQRSCSLPHSPAHISYMDVDNGRTSFSFQDLNINDLPELDDGNVDKNLAKVNSENDYVPRTLTDENLKEFLIPNKSIETVKSNAKQDVDDFNELDMYLEAPFNSVISYSSTANDTPTSKLKFQSRHSPSDEQKPILKNITTDVTTNIPNLLSYHISKSHRPIKTELNTATEVDADDCVHVESFNETTSIPVLEANNLSSLLEQFEASEKVTNSLPRNKITDGLTSGTRLQDAAMQLNKNKIRQILISTTTPKCAEPKESDVAVHSDHDYCSPKKRQNIITSIEKGQSLLKPEVLSSNNRIWKSRHRTCKNKKVIYHISSDDETDNSVSNNKNKTYVKPNAKTPLQSNHKKKLSPVYSVPSVSVKRDSNDSVISHMASKPRDNCSQGSSGSIKLTIKNKSKVILNLNCDSKKDSLKYVNSNEYIKIKDSSSTKIVPKNEKSIEKNKISSPICTSKVKNVSVENSTEPLVIKEETRPIKQKSKDFYMTLFDNKQDLKTTFNTSIPKKEINEKTLSMPEIVSQQITHEIKQRTKKKISLQEYELRKEVGSSNSGTQNTEAIFLDIPKVAVPKVCEPAAIKSEPEKSNNISNLTPNANFETLSLKTELIKHSINMNDSQKSELEQPKKIFDPISEASRKILMNKKQKAEAMRKRDEDIVMSKIFKIDNYKPQPLAEILNIAENISEVTPPTPLVNISPQLLDEKTLFTPEIVSQQITPDIKQPTKKKISLQEYKLRKEIGSSNPRTVSPDAIFPDVPKVAVPKVCEPTAIKSKYLIIKSEPEKNNNISNLTPKTNFEISLKTELIEHPINMNDLQKSELEPPKRIFDPTSEASRKILMNKKQKAEAMRKRDEDIVMSEIPKIENCKPWPLSETLNIAEEIPEVTPLVIVSLGLIYTSDYEEIVMVSVGVNTDPAIFKMLEPIINNSKKEGKDIESLDNFKIKKSDNVLKHNVFGNVKQDKKSPQHNTNTKRPLPPSTGKELKIDKERYKNITKTLKHVERNFEAKISSNSLFSNIQDVEKKSKIDKNNEKIAHLKEEESKFDNDVSVNNSNREHKGDFSRVTIVRDYEKSKEHGEDKVIVHLYKARVKPIVNNVIVQTDKLENIIDVKQNYKQITTSVPETTSEFTKTRKRRESDMSLSSECSPVRDVNIDKPENATFITKPNEKQRYVQDYQVKPKERSRRDSRKSPCRCDSKSYRGRSRSENRSSKASKSRSSRSRSRYRSRSPDRCRRYRKSDSSYRRKLSPYRPPSRRNFKRSKHSSYKSRQRTKPCSKSHSNSTHRRSKSPIPKKAKSYPNNTEIIPEVPKKVPPRTIDTSMNPPPIRKPTVSECSESSASTSSSSSSTSESSTSSGSVSSSDRRSVKRRYSLSPDNSKKSNLRKHRKVNELCTRSYSSDGRDSSASVEERKIVLVGKIEKDITKSALKNKFSPFGPIMEVTLHSKENGLEGLPYESSNTSALAPQTTSPSTSRNEQRLQSSLRTPPPPLPPASAPIPTNVSLLPTPPPSPPLPLPSHTSSSPSLPPELPRYGTFFTLSPPCTPSPPPRPVLSIPPMSSSPLPSFSPIFMPSPPSTPDWPSLPFLLLPSPPTSSSPPPPSTWSLQSQHRTARSTGTLRSRSDHLGKHLKQHAPQKLLRKSARIAAFRTQSDFVSPRISQDTLQRTGRAPSLHTEISISSNPRQNDEVVDDVLLGTLWTTI